jgi:hypothetical protein
VLAQFFLTYFQLKIQMCCRARLNANISLTRSVQHEHIPLKILCGFAAIPSLNVCKALSLLKMVAWEFQPSQFHVGDHVILERQASSLFGQQNCHGLVSFH